MVLKCGTKNDVSEMIGQSSGILILNKFNFKRQKDGGPKWTACVISELMGFYRCFFLAGILSFLSTKRTGKLNPLR